MRLFAAVFASVMEGDSIATHTSDFGAPQMNMPVHSHALMPRADYATWTYPSIAATHNTASNACILDKLSCTASGEISWY